MPNPDYSASAMTARAEIVDVISLYAHALDRRRWELFDVIFHPDAEWRLSSFSGHWRETLKGAREVFERALLTTHHQTGNILISVDGDSAAAETYVTAYHRVRADAPESSGMFSGTGSQYDLVAGMRYIDRFQRRGDRWRIASRVGTSEWRHLQPAADGILSSVPQNFRGRDGDADLSTPVITRFLPACE